MSYRKPNPSSTSKPSTLLLLVPEKMPRKSQEISVAWAMRVSLAQLGARLMAYVATKPHATMLRLALQKSPLKVCHDLPEEMLTKIVSRSYIEFFVFHIILLTHLSEH